MPPSFGSRLGLALALAGAVALSAQGASAEQPARGDQGSVPIAPGIGRAAPAGHPSVSLDELVFPRTLADAPALERHFRQALRKAAHRADWGAGRSARIEYRVVVEELAVTESSGVLRVRCTALGRLPRGKSARSHLDFGGDPSKRSAVVERVLEIVARGVVTRLAALERERRRDADR